MTHKVNVLLINNYLYQNNPYLSMKIFETRLKWIPAHCCETAVNFCWSDFWRNKSQPVSPAILARLIYGQWYGSESVNHWPNKWVLAFFISPSRGAQENRECVYCYGARQWTFFPNILSSSSLVDELTDLSILILILSFFGILRPHSADKKSSSCSLPWRWNRHIYLRSREMRWLFMGFWGKVASPMCTR